MYGALLTVALVEKREPEHPSWTYEEHNLRVPTPVAYNQAPDKPRQSEIAPVKSAHQPIAVFYDPQKAMNRGERWHIQGAHVEVSTSTRGGNGKAWTHAPRGRLKQFQNLINTRRSIPRAFGSQTVDIKGGFI